MPEDDLKRSKHVVLTSAPITNVDSVVSSSSEFQIICCVQCPIYFSSVRVMFQHVSLRHVVSMICNAGNGECVT